jgi:rare lipoprotein A
LKGLVWFSRIAVVVLLFLVCTAHAEVASIYGGRDGLCGHRTASGERLNCAAMTAAHRKLPFGTQIRVCHSGCVTVRINDRGPWVRGRDIDLSPAAAQAIGLYKTSRVTMSASVNAGVTPDAHGKAIASTSDSSH